MRLSRAFPLGSATLVALQIVFSACGSTTASPAAPRELVGRVDGTEAFIGVVMESDHALAYVCDGTEATPAVATWLEGASTESAFDLQAAGVRVQGSLSGSAVSGTVVLADGSRHTFSTAPVTANAGVYRDGTSYVGALGGWVVLGDGSLRGAVRIDTGLLSVNSTVTSGVVTASTGNLSLTGTRVTISKVSTTTTADAGATSCTAATTCSGHGLCSATGTCACNPGFTGASCNTCATSFFGFPLCKFCSAATTCSGHGTCDASGNCTCNVGFSGPTCQ